MMMMNEAKEGEIVKQSDAVHKGVPQPAIRPVTCVRLVLPETLDGFPTYPRFSSESDAYVIATDRHSVVTLNGTSVLGKGTYGAVYSGNIKVEPGVDSVVAVKVTRRARDEIVCHEELREVALVRNLPVHRNVVACIRVALSVPSGLGMVFERGVATLEKCIALSASSKMPWSQEALLKCARHITTGIAFLHSNGVFHNDLSTTNVLLFMDPPTQQQLATGGAQARDDLWELPNARFAIADFGLASSMNTRSCRTPEYIMNVSFRSPERVIGMSCISQLQRHATGRVREHMEVPVAEGGGLAEASDCWVVGCIMVRMLCKTDMPWNDYSLRFNDVHSGADILVTRKIKAELAAAIAIALYNTEAPRAMDEMCGISGVRRGLAGNNLYCVLDKDCVSATRDLLARETAGQPRGTPKLHTMMDRALLGLRTGGTGEIIRGYVNVAKKLLDLNFATRMSAHHASLELGHCGYADVMPMDCARSPPISEVQVTYHPAPTSSNPSPPILQPLVNSPTDHVLPSGKTVEPTVTLVDTLFTATTCEYLRLQDASLKTKYVARYVLLFRALELAYAIDAVTKPQHRLFVHYPQYGGCTISDERRDNMCTHCLAAATLRSAAIHCVAATITSDEICSSSRVAQLALLVYNSVYDKMAVPGVCGRWSTSECGKLDKQWVINHAEMAVNTVLVECDMRLGEELVSTTALRILRCGRSGIIEDIDSMHGSMTQLVSSVIGLCLVAKMRITDRSVAAAYCAAVTAKCTKCSAQVISDTRAGLNAKLFQTHERVSVDFMCKQSHTVISTLISVYGKRFFSAFSNGIGWSDDESILDDLYLIQS